MSAPGSMPRRHHAWTPIAFLAPAGLVLGVFVVMAFVQVIGYSFTRYTAFQGPDFVGLENYSRLLSSDRFWRCLGNSGLYLLVTPALIGLSLSAALIVHSGLRGLGWLRLALFLPVVTPTIVAALAWRLLLQDQGVIGSLVSSATGHKVGLLTQYPWTLMSPMLVTLWKGFGYYMMIFLAGLLAVPKELEEAARIDGASRMGVLWHVVVPSLWPVVTLVGMVSSISALKVFDELYVTVKGVPIEQQTGVPLVYDWAVERGDYGMASAVGIALFVVILAFSLVNLRLSQRKGVAA